jgi:alkanesulfonate monooxygenase SsuD/methylene tetrahydromethanopterin reductase-like flavin-dependent oxidoreductase (luciferase family)
VRFGVGDFSGQRPPGSSAAHAQLHAELLDQAEQIEVAGLDAMWVSEHHFAGDGYMPSVLPIAAALLARTRRIVVATDRLAASLHDPMRLAEDAIALDLLSRGRFSLGLSPATGRRSFRIWRRSHDRREPARDRGARGPRCLSGTGRLGRGTECDRDARPGFG